MQIPSFEPERLAEQFEAGQAALGCTIEISPATQVMPATQADMARMVLESGATQPGGFIRRDVSVNELISNPELKAILGSVVLFPDRIGDTFTPMTIRHVGESALLLTRLAQPFVPSVGYTKGQNFGLTLGVDTSAEEFGNHNAPDRTFEGAHFSTLVVGARNAELARDILATGDQAQDRLIAKGVPQVMTANGLLGIDPANSTVLDVKRSGRYILPLAWHKSLGERGLAVPDYPDAVKQMIGSGFDALGTKGLTDVQRLADKALRDNR